MTRQAPYAHIEKRPYANANNKKKHIKHKGNLRMYLCSLWDAWVRVSPMNTKHEDSLISGNPKILLTYFSSDEIRDIIGMKSAMTINPTIHPNMMIIIGSREAAKEANCASTSSS